MEEQKVVQQNGSDKKDPEKVSAKKRIIKFLEDAYLGEGTYNKINTKLINTVKVFIVSSRKFIVDDCFTKASAIAYTTIISLIPTLFVGLTFYSIFAGMGDKKEELFRKITVFMVEHNIRLDIDPVLESISSLIENAGKIGGITAVILVFTATAVLRTLERSLNDVWNVKKQRNLFMKLIYYWSALTLGPVMLIAGTTIATKLSVAFSPPNLNSAYYKTDKTLWIAGQKSSIQYTGKSDSEFNSLSADNIDFENQLTFSYDGARNTFTGNNFRIEKSNFQKFDFRDIQFIGEFGWIVGKNGIIITTDDNGANWNLFKWGSINFNDIYMLSESKGFVVADNGLLFRTDDGGLQWKSVPIDNLSVDLNAIRFHNNRGIVVGNRSTYLLSEDRGETWALREIKEARRNKHTVNFNNLYFTNEYTVWVAGDEGFILKSVNGGYSWSVDRITERNFNTVYFKNSLKGYIAGNKGTVLLTEDGGQRWFKKDISSRKINRILSAGNELIALGDAGTILKSQDEGLTWYGREGGKFMAFLLNFFAPFLIIWLLFLIMYMLLPNMKVPFKPAAAGASFTAAVWVGFILFFIVYVKSFATGTVAIYGGLAAIPLFLIMVYASTLILLYGAEISYTLMHPYTYKNLKKTFREEKDITIYYGLAILYHIYKNFENGKGPTQFKDLLKITLNNAFEADYFINMFKKENLIMIPEEGGFIPSTSAKKIVISDIIDLAHDKSLSIPGYVPSDSLKRYFQKVFADMRNSRKELIKDTTLADIMQEVG